jgi:hypothetical protein
MADGLRLLGKRPPKHDPRTLRLARFLTADLAPPPPEVNWTGKVSRLGMMLNDSIGDCGLAAPGHFIQTATAENGVEFIPSDDQILKAYEDISGFNPADPSTDHGVYLLDVMKYWRTTGIAGHKIEAFAALDLKNRDHFMQAIYLGGGLVIGWDLPESAQVQEEWTLAMGGMTGSPRAGSWGGHATTGSGYRAPGMTADGILTITWGQPLWAGWDFVDAYADEAYMVVLKDWVGVNGTPAGQAMQALLAAMKEITQ